MPAKATFRDLVPTVDFNSQKTHIIEFDPGGELKEFEGARADGTIGRYPAVLVREDGKPAWLAVSSNRLTRKLQQYEKPATLKITRTGEKFESDYIVEPE